MSIVALYGSREVAPISFWRRMSVRVAAYKTYRQTLVELQEMTDPELADLGMSRFEVPLIARKAALIKEEELLKAAA